MTGAEALGGEEDFNEDHPTLESRAEAVVRDGAAARSPTCWRVMLARSGYIEALEAERTIEAQGADREPRAAGRGRARVRRPRRARARTARGVPAADRARRRRRHRSDDEGLVTLMTLHNAKGLEYPIVFITGCEDGVFPHSRAIEEGGLEEERRLCYVGVTRAMRQLYLTSARRRAVFGAASYGLRSRFLDRDPGRPARRGRRSWRLRAATFTPYGSASGSLRSETSWSPPAGQVKASRGAGTEPRRRI